MTSIFDRATVANLIHQGIGLTVATMPELIILISTIFCVGSAVIVYFNRSNASATGVAVLSFIALLYGVGQYVSPAGVDGRQRQYLEVAEKRDAWMSASGEGDKAKLPTGEMQASELAKPLGDTKPPDKILGQASAGAPDAGERQADSANSTASVLPLPQPNQLSGVGVAPPAVIISNLTAKKAGSKFLDVAGTVTNANEFAIKNVVVKCGDASFAGGDVLATIEMTVAPKSTVEVTGLRLGPIKTGLPPTTCQVEKYDRAD